MKPLGQKSIAILHALKDGKPRDFLVIERESTQTTIIDLVHRLKKSEYIEALPKKAQRLIEYRITTKGLKALGMVEDAKSALSARNLMSAPTYVPVTMQPPRGQGSMRAYDIPSRVNNRLVANPHA